MGHLEEVGQLAHKQGGLVWVSITADPFVDKGPGRPLMTAVERAIIVGHLRMIDHVIIDPHRTAVEAIKSIKPRWYCKGADYRSKEPSADLAAEIAAVRSVGGDILYTSEPVRHSTDYLRRYMDANRI